MSSPWLWKSLFLCDSDWMFFFSLCVSPVLIVCALFLCWMPNQIRRLMTAAVPKSAWTVSYLSSYVKLHPVADTFFYLSSVLNPLLYNLSSRQFRSAFWHTLLCRLSLQHINKRTLESSQGSRSSGNTIRPLLHRSLNRIRRSTSEKSTGLSKQETQHIQPVTECPAEIEMPSSHPQEEETNEETSQGTTTEKQTI